MFDIGGSELVVIAVVALIAIGPKELPGVLRMVGKWMGKARKMAAEFQGQFNEAMREAEMADLKKSFDEVKEATTGLAGGNLLTSLQKDVGEAMSLDKAEHIDTPPELPTTPEPPTPETFVEAETHAAAMPLAITSEPLPAPASEPRAAANDIAAAPPDAAHDVVKDAKAS